MIIKDTFQIYYFACRTFLHLCNKHTHIHRASKNTFNHGITQRCGIFVASLNIAANASPPKPTCDRPNPSLPFHMNRIRVRISLAPIVPKDELESFPLKCTSGQSIYFNSIQSFLSSQSRQGYGRVIELGEWVSIL